MFEQFTDRARKVMALANQEAQHLYHEYIGTEHILLGLVKEQGGTGANVLLHLGVDLSKVRLEVEKLVKRGPEMVTMGKLPQTPRAKKVIEYAMEESRNFHHKYLGTEHLLLGLLRVQDGVACQILENLGAQLESVREEVLNVLGSGDADTDAGAFQHSPRSTDDIEKLKLRIELWTLQKKDCINRGEVCKAAQYHNHICDATKQIELLTEKVGVSPLPLPPPSPQPISREMKVLDQEFRVSGLDLNGLVERSKRAGYQVEGTYHDFVKLKFVVVDVDNYPVLANGEIGYSSGRALILHLDGENILITGKSALRLAKELLESMHASTPIDKAKEDVQRESDCLASLAWPPPATITES